MPARTPTRLALVTAASAAVLSLGLPGLVADAAARTGGATATDVVLLRAPAVTAGAVASAARVGASASAPRAAALTAQASVAGEAVALGGDVLARTTVPDTLTVRLSATSAAALRRNPLVERVAADVALPGPTDPVVSTGPASGVRGTAPSRTSASCGTFQHPQLDPEALSAIDDTPSSTLGYDGKGVKVAFLADGVQVSNPDFRRNAAYASASSPAGSRVITVYKDFSGDGTTAGTDGGEAFLDSSSIAAQGNAVYDLSRYVAKAHPLPRGCDVKIVGAAPGATVYALKIFASNNETTLSGFVQAINYAVAQGVSVINESFGINGFPDTATDIVRDADEAAEEAGVTVVVSSGDAGVNSTMGSPATDPDVLAVGATTTFRAYQQDTFGGINLPGEHDRYLGGNISSFSSGGFAQDGKTVNLVAPGDLNWALCSTSSSYSDCDHESIQLTGGTSESAPLTSGAAADVIEAYRASHHGTNPTPSLVMQLLTSSARDIYAPADQQGAGLLDVAAAVRLALSAPGTTRADPPGGLLTSVTQADLGGQPSSTVGQDVSLTNTGTSALRVTASTRGLEPFHTVSGAVRLQPAVRTRQPKFPVWSGADEVYQTATLHVGQHVARIQLDAAYQYTRQTSLVHVALFSPQGQLVGYSNPQGVGDYADVEVSRPAAGTWTAAFFTVWDGVAGELGTTGRVPWTFSELRFVPVGHATPSTLTLAAGATGTVHYADTLPSTPGDSSAALVLHTGSGASATQHTVPIVLRTFVPIGSDGGRFRGALTGGNGRGGAPGQTNTYDFVVPSGETDLDVGVALANDRGSGDLPGAQLVGLLEDPEDQVVGYDTNFTVATSDSGTTEVVTRFLDLYAAAPQAGTWQLVLEWVQPVVGLYTSIPFTGSVEFDQVSASTNLPDSSGTDVAPGGTTYSIHVKNTGVAPMLLSVDARLDTTTTLTLGDVRGYGPTQNLPGASDSYYVPPETSTLAFDETSTIPSSFDASFDPGDPDLSPQVPAPYATESWTDASASLSYSPPDGLTAGLWNVYQADEGPYPTGGEPHGQETTTATATTLAFDPAVSYGVPDSVQVLLNGGSLAPDVVPAGTSSVLTATIDPTASTGSVVKGQLFVNGLCPGSLLLETFAETGLFTSTLAAFPYEYTVGS